METFKNGVQLNAFKRNFIFRILSFLIQPEKFVRRCAKSIKDLHDALVGYGTARSQA